MFESAKLPRALTVVLATLSVAGADPIFVSPSGRDGRAGTADTPLATLGGARDRVRELKKGGVAVDEVIFAAGTYWFVEPVVFDDRDSGLPTAPVVYRAATGHKVRFSGGSNVEAWSPVDEAPALSRLPDTAREHVLVADLKAQGITEYGEIPLRPGSRDEMAEPELFWLDLPMTLARYPNEGFRGVHEVSADLRKVKLDSDRPSRWLAETDPWITAYWYYDWSEQFEPIVAIDADSAYAVSRSPDIDTGGTDAAHQVGVRRYADTQRAFGVHRGSQVGRESRRAKRILCHTQRSPISS